MTTRLTSTKDGWKRTGRHEYQHATGLRIRQDVNTRRWEVIGASAMDGDTFRTMALAMHYATRTKFA